MYHSIFLTVLLLCSSCYTIAFAFPPRNGINPTSQTILTKTDYTFRDLVKEDLDDLTTVLIDAFSPSPDWHYVRPEYEKYRDYTWYCVRSGFMWEESMTGFAKVVAVPNPNASAGERKERVVAAGLWNFMERHNKTQHNSLQSLLHTLQTGFLPPWASQLDTTTAAGDTPKYNCSAHLDLNETRAYDYSRQLMLADQKYIEDAYPKQLYLGLLATHPDWDGHGFAARNLYWGIELAQKLGTPVTLIATPAGYPVYKDVGFLGLTNFSVKALDGWEGEDFWFEVMEYA
jgi:hypothetical protein